VVKRYESGHDVDSARLCLGKHIVQVCPVRSSRARDNACGRNINAYFAAAGYPYPGRVYTRGIQRLEMRVPESRVIGAAEIVPVIPRSIGAAHPYPAAAYLELRAVCNNPAGHSRG
jgi:hypothetical protein